MDAARWANVAAARRSYFGNTPQIDAWPAEAFMEMSARCNIRCQMCAINYDPRYKPKQQRPFFEPDLFERLRPIFPTLLIAHLFGLGEPTMNRHLVDYIRELASHGVETWFNTNATLIDEKRAEDLASAGISRISVSVDGATQQTYEEIRRGATWESLLRGIRALVAASKRHGNPRVNLSMVAMASNAHEIPMLVDLAADLGVDGVHVEPLFVHAATAELVDHYSRENLGLIGREKSAAIFADAEARAARHSIWFQSRLSNDSAEFDYVKASTAKPYTWMCSEPWSTISVTSAGEVRTCCANDVSFGNLHERTIEEIWNGEAYRTFREQHARRETARGCANCMMNGRARHSPMFRALKPVVYAPLFEEFPAPRNDDAVAFTGPLSGETVTDPLIVRGALHPSARAEELELMIDQTAVANFRDAAYLRGNTFAMCVPVAFVSDGAHVVWARRRGESQGVGHRDVFLWRPPVVDAIRVIHEALLVLESRASVWPSLSIDGDRWKSVQWKKAIGARGSVWIGRVDLHALTPGKHQAEVTQDGRLVERRMLFRLASGPLLRLAPESARPAERAHP